MIGSGKNRQSIVVRLAGDSGDGIQLMGSQFTASTALSGSDFTTFPDYPAEIRAPAGTTYGVSAYQINLGPHPITTAGDSPDVLVAFNPAALKVNVPLLPKGALVILDHDTFTARNLRKAGYAEDPRKNTSLTDFQIVAAAISRLNAEAVNSYSLSKSEGSRCKNFWALGLLLWMFDLDRSAVESWIGNKLRDRPVVRDANIGALRSGHAYGETTELSVPQKPVHRHPETMPPGLYRSVSGSEAMALGIAAAGELADRRVFFSSYPITPASPLLHQMYRLGETGIGTFQAEDEIAAVCAAIGASYAGMVAVTSSSGPGIALMTEAIGLAVSAELPLVVINWQRGGPSTGLPTKTEQSDLYQAMYGRNSDTPIPVLAAATPADCFRTAIEAVRIALRHMTAVMVLADGYLANSTEPWLIPNVTEEPPIEREDPAPPGDDPQRAAFRRNPYTFARPWITPGMPSFMHRIGGLEKDHDTGHISYEPDNHARMSRLRQDKVDSVRNFIPDQDIRYGLDRGHTVVVGWGSTYGPLYQAARQTETSFVHIRHINPLPSNLGNVLGRFDNILVPEMNSGQLCTVLRDKLHLRPIPFTKISGQPFLVSELVGRILAIQSTTSQS